MRLHGGAFALALQTVEKHLPGDAGVERAKGWGITKLINESQTDAAGLLTLQGTVAGQLAREVDDFLRPIKAYELLLKPGAFIAVFLFAALGKGGIKATHSLGDCAGDPAHVRLEGL